jgi:Ca2+-binding EF-hand superfamily protein
MERGDIRMHRNACLLIGLLAFVAVPALGDEATNSHDPRAAFTETDANHDGRIDREEFHHRVVEIFFHGDTDKDGYMTPTELQASVVFPEDFQDADRDADGRISLYEFVRVRFATFDEVDSDGDGLLSVEEVVVAFEVES